LHPRGGQRSGEAASVGGTCKRCGADLGECDGALACRAGMSARVSMRAAMIEEV
jgi:hypothetical protein